MGSEVKEVGIVATGTDKGASALLKKTGAGVDKLGRISEKSAKKIAKVGKASKGATGDALQMRNAMFEVGNSLAMGGNQAGIMANQFIEAAARMVGSGGLGIAIGAVTTAVAAGTIAWRAFSTDTREAAKRLKEVADETEAAKKSIESMVTALLKGAQGEVGFQENAIAAALRDVTEAREKLSAAQKKADDEEMESRRRMSSLSAFAEGPAEPKFAALRKQAGKDEKKVLATMLEQLDVERRKLFIINEQARQRDVKIESDKRGMELERARAELAQKHEREKIEAFNRVEQHRQFLSNLRMKEERAAARELKELDRARARQQKEDAMEAAKRTRAETDLKREAGRNAVMISRIAGSIIAADGEEARKAAISNALDIATVTISAKAAEGAAGAFTSAVKELGWFFGPVVGAAAGTAVFASIMALRTQVIGMATGGAVQGKDSINAKLMPGEVVLPAGFIRDLSRIASSRGAASPQPSTFANGDTGGRSAGGGLSVTNNFSTLVLDSISAKREARRSNRELSKLRSRGML